MAVIQSPTPGAHFSNGLSTQAGSDFGLNICNAVYPIATSTRWQWNLTGAESTSNAGSNLQLQAIADDGFTVVATAISVNRATGAVTITGGGATEYFADGTVSAPSIANTTNHGSGVYFTTNAVNVTANGVRAMSFATATTGVNYLVATPAAASGDVAITAAGSDTDIGLILTGKGGDPVSLGGTTVANGSLHVTTASTSVDFLNVTGSATGTHTVLVAAAGTDTDVTLSLQSKGSGTVAIGGTTQANSSLQVATVASSVDYLSVSGSVTGTHVVLVAAAGTDTDVSLSLQGKGAGPTLLGVNATSNVIAGTNAALANGATAGLFMIPTTSGTPSGTPVGHGAGNAAVIADTSGSFKLFVYFEGTGWKSVTLS